MLRRLLLLNGVLFSAIAAGAQPVFKAAEITFISGENRTGEIDYRNWTRFPDQISFRTAARGSARQIPIDSVSLLKIGNAWFYRARVSIEGGLESDASQFLPYTNLISETLMLERLLDAPKPVFRTFTKSGKVQFFLRADTGFVLLEYREFDIDPSPRFDMQRIETYKKQLADFFSACASSAQILNDADYTSSDIIEVVKQLNECSGARVGYIQTSTLLTRHPGVVAMGSLSSNVTVDATSWPFRDAQFDLQRGFMAGISYDFRFIANGNRITYRLEALVQPVSVSGKSEYYNSSGGKSEINTFELTYTYIRLNGNVRYKPVASRFPLFYEAGIGFGQSIQASHYVHTQPLPNGTEITRRPYNDGRQNLLTGFVGTEYQVASVLALLVRAEFGRISDIKEKKDLARPSFRSLGLQTGLRITL